MRRVGAASAAVAVLALLAGCGAAADPVPTVEDVVAERRATMAEGEAARFAAFLEQSGDRVRELGLPSPRFQGLVDIALWDAVVTDCVEQFAPGITLARLEGGFRVLDPGPSGESAERIRWTIESCAAQHGMLDPRGFDAEPGPVERSWRHRDLIDRLLPCLRAAGLAAPVPPGAGEVDALHAIGGFDPYGALARDPRVERRAQALCPPAEALIEAHERRGEAS